MTPISRRDLIRSAVASAFVASPLAAAALADRPAAMPPAPPSLLKEPTGFAYLMRLAGLRLIGRPGHIGSMVVLQAHLGEQPAKAAAGCWYHPCDEFRHVGGFAVGFLDFWRVAARPGTKEFHEFSIETVDGLMLTHSADAAAPRDRYYAYALPLTREQVAEYDRLEGLANRE